MPLRPNELGEWRSLVIEKSINLEWLVSATISQHYFGQVHGNFIIEILYDEYFNFGLKCSVLEKVLGAGQNKLIQDLRRLARIRNHFAHRGPHVVTPTDPEGFAPDPRKPGVALDFKSLFDDFFSIYPRVEQSIVEAFQAKGGVLSGEAPWPVT